MMACGSAEGRDDDDGTAHIRHQVPQHHPAGSATQCVRRYHILAPRQQQHLGTHQSRHAGPADDADDDERQWQRRPDCGGERNQEQQARKGEGDVGEAHHHQVHGTAEVASQDAEREPESHGNHL